MLITGKINQIDWLFLRRIHNFYEHQLINNSTYKDRSKQLISNREKCLRKICCQIPARWKRNRISQGEKCKKYQIETFASKIDIHNTNGTKHNGLISMGDENLKWNHREPTPKTTKMHSRSEKSMSEKRIGENHKWETDRSTYSG